MTRGQGSPLDKAHFDRSAKDSHIYFQLSPFNSSGLLNPRSCVRTVIGTDLPLFFFFFAFFSPPSPGIADVFLVCLFIPCHPLPMLAFFFHHISFSLSTKLYPSQSPRDTLCTFPFFFSFFSLPPYRRLSLRKDLYTLPL